MALRFGLPPEPIEDGDDVVRASVAGVPVPPLLAAVAHLTGELELLRDDLRPDLTKILQPDGGYGPDQVAAARELATEALLRRRDAGNPPPPGLAPDELRRIVEFVAGRALDDDELPLHLTELAVDGADLRRPAWRATTPRTVVVVGAGMSGLLVAHRLRQAGVEVEVLEKNADVGGTWFENRYPGCRVDIQNHFYSYACAQTPDWPHHHSTQPVLLEYFRTCAERFGVRDRIRFGTEVLEARWLEDEASWLVRMLGPDGTEREARYDAVVCATGQLNRPKLPDLQGVGDFAGPAFHSARWDDSVELAGRRVGVIGTGASALQFIPPLAEQAAALTVFQRTPPWLLPVPTYQEEIGGGLRWLLRHVPQFANWDRLWIFCRTNEGLLPLATVEEGWDASTGAVGSLNEVFRSVLAAWYESAFPDPELRAKMLPTYPPIAKRVVLDDGTVARVLQQPHVHLETTGIERITSGGVRLVDGREVDLDVLVYGTGFAASDFLTPMRVVGRDGVDLHQRWGGNARAYLGITIPGFPNLFLMYGPNTNIVINGSITYFSECQAQYVLECLRLLDERGARALDVRPEVHDAYNVEIDEGNAQRAWGASDVSTWYRNRLGRIAQNWPFDLGRYWRVTRTVEPSDYAVS